MSTAVLVYNPAAGRFSLSQKRLQLLLEKLYHYGIRAEAVQARAGEEVSRWLNLAGKRLLIVYGGDGTLHQVVEEALSHEVTVGLLPAGTANVLARELSIPLDPERALQIVARGVRKRIHLGLANQKHFHLMAGIGLDAFVVSRVKDERKRAFGFAAFWLSTLRSLLEYPFRSFELNVDGDVYEGTFAVIGNTRLYGGNLLVTPRASLDEPSLDVCIFTGRRRLRHFQYVLGTFSGNHIRFKDVIYRKAQEVELRAHDSILVQMDGELARPRPNYFRVSDKQLEILVP